MDPFPLSDIPSSNLLSVLGKMTFLEASRMRATCRQIEGIVAQSSRLSFAQDDTLTVAVRRVVNPLNIQSRDTPLGLAVWIDRRQKEWCTINKPGNKVVRKLCNRFYTILPAEVIRPYNVECAYFEKIEVGVSGPWVSNVSPPLEPALFFKEAKINKCYWLDYVAEVEIEKFDLMMWVRLLHPRGVSYVQTGTIAMAFDVLRELADTGCKFVFSTLCDYFAPDYASILLKYEWIWIDQVAENAMPSMEPLVQLLLDDVASAVGYCRLPIYNREHALTPGEVEALGLAEKRIRWTGDKENHLAFFVTTSEYFVTIYEFRTATWQFRGSQQHYFVIRRASKRDIAKFVDGWIAEFLPKTIPYDPSDLYEFVEKYRDDYETIRDHLETVFTHISTYDSSPNLIVHRW